MRPTLTTPGDQPIEHTVVLTIEGTGSTTEVIRTLAQALHLSYGPCGKSWTGYVPANDEHPELEIEYDNNNQRWGEKLTLKERPLAVHCKPEQKWEQF